MNTEHDVNVTNTGNGNMDAELGRYKEGREAEGRLRCLLQMSGGRQPMIV